MTRGVLLSLALLVPYSLVAQEAAKGVIEGTVVDEVSGEPVRRASVMLSAHVANKPPESTAVQTQADGRFRFEGLDAGVFRLNAQKVGYSFEDSKGTIQSIQLAASEQKTGVTIKLSPLGVVSGRVFDEEGDPVRGAMVQLLQRRKIRGKFQWQQFVGTATNDRGEYRAADLRAGDYAVSAVYSDPMSNMGVATQQKVRVYATTYYPNGVDVNAAQMVAVQKGGETGGIDVQLQKEPAYRVRVRVEGVPAEMLAQTHVQLFPWEQGSGAFRGVFNNSRTLEPGVFELRGVRAGSWIVQAQAFQQGADSLTGMTQIDVTTSDLNDVVVRIGASFAVTGNLVFEGTPATKVSWKNYNINLAPPEALGFRFGVGGGRSTVTDDGGFTLTNTTPGKYLISVQGPLPDSNSYLASIKIGADEYFGKEIDFTNGPPGQLKIIYRNDAAKVSGKLEGEFSGNQESLGIAVLVPVEPHLRRIEHMPAANVKPDGSFAFAGPLRPGEYLVCHMPGGLKTLGEEGEPTKESMEAAVKLKVEPRGTHTVQLKVVKVAEQP